VALGSDGTADGCGLYLMTSPSRCAASPRPAQRRRVWSWAIRGGFSSCGWRGRQVDCECGALAEGAGGGDVAAVGLDQLAADGLHTPSHGVPPS
jgi:hypothetical protein